ncbi:MAG: hypothetical protein ACTSRG_16710 [Candidatus Helarchaeota archaeon]
MPSPIIFLSKRFAVTNPALETAEIISKMLSDFLNKPHKHKKTEFGFQIKARKGLIYDPQLIEINIIEKTGSLNYTIIQISFGITQKGFGDKSAEFTKELLQKGLDEILETILPKMKLIGIDEQNICLKCGKVNFPMAGFCVQCNAELQPPVRELPIKEIKSIVDNVGIIEEEKGELKTLKTEKKSIAGLMDTITGIIDGNVDPETLEEKKEKISSFKLGRCKYCNWAIDEKEYTFRDKGYEVRCKNCNEILD